jgi:tripartite-type tricarboxylate transporter receptor subunit TctC
MTMTRRRGLTVIAAGLAAPFLPVRATTEAGAWPAHTITAIVPLSAGSTIDVVARIVFDPLSRQLGQTIICENRAGAGGTIGAGLVARAAPDGHTLLINSSQHSVTPAAYPHAAFDVARDFAAVACLGSSPTVTVVSPARGFKTLADLVAAAKAKPGGFTYATAGVGSATHLSTERLRHAAGFAGVHVPFRGMPEALTEVMTGRVDFSCSSIAAALPLIRQGQLQALAVSTPQRTPALPQVPTTIEAGYAESDYTFWTGMFVPAKTPRDIVDRLHTETMRALHAPGVQEKLKQQGIDPVQISPVEFDAQIKREIASIQVLWKAADIRLN